MKNCCVCGSFHPKESGNEAEEKYINIKVKPEGGTLSDVPDEKWNDWHWQVSSVSDVDTLKYLPLTRGKGMESFGSFPNGNHTLLSDADRPQ